MVNLSSGLCDFLHPLHGVLQCPSLEVAVQFAYQFLSAVHG